MNNKSKVVSPQDFGRFLAWLDPDPNVAGEFYNNLQRKLTIYFMGRGCGAWAAELASQTLDRTMMKHLEGGEIEEREPGRYIFQVAGFILLEHLKRPPTTPLAVQVPATTATVDNRIEVQCCKRCLAQLPEKERGVLQDYYLGEKKGESKRIRGDVASDVGVLAGALRIKVFRMKQKILKCITACVQGGTVDQT